MNQNLLRAAILVLMIVLASCGNPPATVAVPAAETQAASGPTVTVSVSSPVPATMTPDPCVLPQLEEEVQQVHRHMREFDDAASLASSVPREQLSSSVTELQRIRREAEDELVPACLTDLKLVQLQHMNTVINTLLSFMQGSIDEETLNQAIALARQQHDQYTLELAQVIGLTVVPVTAAPAPSGTPTP
jgi:hypothetical protein